MAREFANILPALSGDKNDPLAVFGRPGQEGGRIAAEADHARAGVILGLTAVVALMTLRGF
jgi:hypothetical protein